MNTIDIRPDRSNVQRVTCSDVNLRLDLELDDIVKNSIKHVLLYRKNPLDIESNIANTNTTIEGQSYYTLKMIFNCMLSHQYALPQIRFASAPLIKTNYPEYDAILSYLYTCKPAKLSTMLTLLAVLKHMTISRKDKWRKMYNPTRHRWYSSDNSLLFNMSSYLYNHYVTPNLDVTTRRSGTDSGTSRYVSHSSPNIHWFWESQDRWIENDLEFTALASMIVKSGLVTIFPMYSNSSRSGAFYLSHLNLCVTPEITEEFISDHLEVCTNPDYFITPNQGSNYHISLVSYITPAVTPARAEVLHEAFKRFNRIRTQILMRIPYLLDDSSVFGSDIMTLEFEAETRIELKPVVSSYKNFVSTICKYKTLKPRPMVEVLSFIRDYYDYHAKVNEEFRRAEYLAPAIAIGKVMSSMYRGAQAVAILESHLREYR